MEPWVVKYLPKNTSEIQGQNAAVERLKEYVTNYSKQKKRAALVYGPPGCGKTASVHALASELGLELVEINASDHRNKSGIEEKLGPVISQHSLFGGGKLILVDEIDGVSGTKDRGGISALTTLIKKSTFPIVCTANNPWDSKFSTLRRNTESIQFRTLAYPSIKAVLKRICKNEGIEYDDIALTKLSTRAGGDLRGAITDMQTAAGTSKTLDLSIIDEISGRRQTESMISALMKVLKTTKEEVALGAYDDVEDDLDSIFLWLDENIPKEYKKKQDLARAYEVLSRADILKGRIMRRQYWRFMAYIYDLLSAGIAVSKNEKYQGYNKYQRSNRLLVRWQANARNAKKKTIAEKIADVTHTSFSEAYKNIPFFRAMCMDTELALKLSEELELNHEEFAWLTSR